MALHENAGRRDAQRRHLPPEGDVEVSGHHDAYALRQKRGLVGPSGVPDCDPRFTLSSFRCFGGRYTSEGEFYPFRHESADGYDAVEWLPRCRTERKSRDDGGSYVGATQMLAAIVHPPHLAGICPV